MSERIEELRQALREASRWAVAAIPADEPGAAEAWDAAARSRLVYRVDPDDPKQVVVTQGGELVATMTRAELREVVAP